MKQVRKGGKSGREAISKALQNGMGIGPIRQVLLKLQGVEH